MEYDGHLSNSVSLLLKYFVKSAISKMTNWMKINMAYASKNMWNHAMNHFESIQKKLLNRPNKYIQETDCRLGFDIGDATNSWFYKSQNDLISRPPVTSDGLLNQSYACFYPPFFH